MPTGLTYICVHGHGENCVFVSHGSMEGEQNGKFSRQEFCLRVCWYSGWYLCFWYLFYLYLCLLIFVLVDICVCWYSWEGGIMRDVATNGSLAQPLKLINLFDLILFQQSNKELFYFLFFSSDRSSCSDDAIFYMIRGKFWPLMLHT